MNSTSSFNTNLKGRKDDKDIKIIKNKNKKYNLPDLLGQDEGIPLIHIVNYATENNNNPGSRKNKDLRSKLNTYMNNYYYLLLN